MNSDRPDSDSDSDTSSAPSRPQSPPAPASPAAPPTLARLISHFLSAKRSLNATSFVYRANELVTTSRSLVEEVAILNARNSYSARETGGGVEVLVKIKDGITREGEVVSGEFGRVLERLDVANGRLEKTLAELKGAVVDNSLQRNATENGDEDDADVSEAGDDISAEGQEVGDERTLYSFIDPTKHEELHASLRKDIDDFYSSRGDLDHTLETFVESLQTIGGLLSQDSRKPVPGRSPLYNDDSMPIADLFTGMEEHATAMAGLLGSLVRHYDLCVTALKHTEGGGEAAKRAIQQVDGEQMNGAAMEESLYQKTAEPISEEERNEMLGVLENDAEEVEDVVSELRDRNQEQESLFTQLSDHTRDAKHLNTRLREAVSMLHEMKDLHLPSHLHALKTFRQSWQRIRDSILDKTESLLSLTVSNEKFLAAYSYLLAEVDRRKRVQTQMQKIADKANKELKKLWEADREMRSGFLDEFGAFLPQGIWGRADEKAGLWEMREVE